MEIKKLRKDKFIKFLIIYFIFLTLSFTIFTLSKYVGTVNQSGTVTIAKWDVNLNTTTGNEGIVNDTLNITSGEVSQGGVRQDYRLTVTNSSEVAVIYTIIVKDLPTGIKVGIDDGTLQDQDANHQVQFSNNSLYTMTASGSNRTKTHKLTFAAPLGTAEINNKGINVEVVFVQKNPNS